MADITVLALIAAYCAYVICRIAKRKRKCGSSFCSGCCAECRGCSPSYIDDLIRSAERKKGNP